MLAGNLKTWFRRTLEILVSSVLLTAALWNIDFSRLCLALAKANYFWLFPPAISVVALLLLKSWRWRLLYYPEFRVPFPSVLTALSAGFLVSNILPARLGEVTGLLLIVGEQPVGVARTASTILLEHLLDVSSLLLILLVLTLAADLPAFFPRPARLLEILAASGIAVMLFMSFTRDRILSWVNRLLKRVAFLDSQNIRDFVGRFLDGFTVMRSRVGLLIVAMSLFGYSLVVATAWSSARALSLEVPFVAIVVAVIVSTTGMIVPSSPGYVGVFHYLVIVSMSGSGVDKDKALAFALLWHTANYLTLSASGCIVLCMRGISLSNLIHSTAMRRLKA